VPVTEEALPDLVRRWQAGWGTARGFRPAEEARGGLHVLLGQPDRHREIVALRTDPASLRMLAAEAAGAARPTWLTVPTLEPEAAETILRAAGLTVHAERERLMTIPLSEHPRHAPRPPYTSEIGETGSVRQAVLRHPSSAEPVARGTVAILGPDAIADRIETVPEQRRRGLGSALMSTLAEHAAALGAKTGILVASPDGQRLYSALGWTVRATVLIGQRREP